jgi:flagellar assembly factor FliW
MTTAAASMRSTQVPRPDAGQLAGGTLYFAAGIPGFPAARTFRAEPWGPQPNPFLVLASEQVAGLRFVVVPPAVFFPGYDPAFGPDVYQAIDAPGPGDVVVLVILTLYQAPEQTTGNLLGPVVVNARSGQAVQAVLSGSGFSPQAPVVQGR